MYREYQCTEKDKRLLVLFAFGALILVSNLVHSYQPERPDKNRSWVEVQTISGKNIVVGIDEAEDSAVNTIRKNFSLTVDNRLVRPHLQPGKTVALIQQPENQVKIGKVSSRLAFLLGQPFSVNSASFEDLLLINGVGPSLANKIISYRETHGMITSAHQLRQINGIGTKTAEKLNNYLTYTVDNEADR